MSFILDALRKAESERNRHVAPVLMDARVAPPRRALPGWAIGLGVVLLLNLGLLAWLLGRSQAPAAAPPADVASAAAVPAGDKTVQAQSAAASTPAAVTPAPLPAPPVAMANPAAAVTPPSASGPSLAATGDEERLPELHELRNAGVSLPDIQLHLHVYTPAPANRSVLLNGQRAREGDYLPNGVKVERITPTAVILEGSGRRFRITVGD
jgi:general secretion pathway protein B